MKNIYILPILIFFTFCSNIKQKDSVFVSILPQKFFVEKIAGNQINVNVMVGNGMSPETYEPLPQQMAALAKSKIYFSIGVPFEDSWLEKIKKNNPGVRFVNTAGGIQKLPMEAEAEIFSESSGEHSHEGTLDPHIWLDPKLVKTQAETIEKALSEIFPEKAELFRQNYLSFVSELDSADSYIRSEITKSGVKEFLVFHPSWGYFAKEYGIRQIPVEIEGKEPGLRELGKIIDFVKKEKINTIFVQKQFSTKSAEAISRETAVAVVQIDPLSEDYINNLKTTADLLCGTSKGEK